MPLKMSVCKKCRIKEFGEEGWNEIAEAWFKGCRVWPEGCTICPHPIITRVIEGMKKKLNPTEKRVIEDIVNLKYGSVIHAVPWKPPLWCPYKGEHK